MQNRLINNTSNEIQLRPLRDNNEEEDQEGNYPETDIEVEDYILTAIEKQIKQNNQVVVSKIVTRSAKTALVFEEGSIITLAIPLRLQLLVEAK